MPVTDKPKIQLTQAQLRAIAGLTREEHLYRQHDALRPIGRAHLVDQWLAAWTALIDAHGHVQDARLGPGWRFRNLSEPRPPTDHAAIAAAQQALAQAQADEAAAWQRIQRLIDRAKEVLRQPPYSGSSTA